MRLGMHWNTQCHPCLEFFIGWIILFWKSESRDLKLQLLSSVLCSMCSNGIMCLGFFFCRESLSRVLPISQFTAHPWQASSCTVKAPLLLSRQWGGMRGAFLQHRDMHVPREEGEHFIGRGWEKGRSSGQGWFGRSRGFGRESAGLVTTSVPGHFCKLPSRLWKGTEKSWVASCLLRNPHLCPSHPWLVLTSLSAGLLGSGSWEWEAQLCQGVCTAELPLCPLKRSNRTPACSVQQTGCLK